MLAILAIHMIGRIGCYCSPVRADSYLYAAFAYRMVHGDVLYADMSLDKPPGLLVINAAAYLFLPAGRWSLIPLETLFLLWGYAAVYGLARDLWGKPAAVLVALAACLSINYFTVMDFTVEGFAMAESYMLGPLLSAARFCRRGLMENRLRGLVLGGVGLGMGLAIKQTALPLMLAVLLHGMGWQAWGGRRTKRAIWGAASIVLGVLVGLAPFAFLLMAQGTWRAGLRDMTLQAAQLLTRETGWPGSWRDVAPLWTPLGWIALSLFCGRSFVPRQMDGTTVPRPAGTAARDVTFLALWQLLECGLLVYLPRRSFHYYVLSFMPLVVLSGRLWAGVFTGAAEQERRNRVTLLAALLLWSGAGFRPALNDFVPASFIRWGQFDREADQQRFEETVRWDNGSLGRNDGRWPGEP